MADQSLSSLTNFAVGLLAARAAGPRDFGLFALAFAIYILALGVSRAVSSDPLVIRYSTVARRRWLSATVSSGGAALTIGAMTGVSCMVAGVIIGGEGGGALLALGLLLPGLLLQDSFRYAFFAEHRGARAFRNDLVWAVGLAAGLSLLVVTDQGAVGWFVLAWGGAANLAALFGVAQTRALPRPLAFRRWWHQHRDLASRYIVEFAAHIGASQLVLFGIGAVAGLTAVGAIRAAIILLGPTTVLLLGANLGAVPQLARLVRTSPDRLVPATALLASTLVAATLAWAVVLLLVPNDLGQWIMGPTWEAARSVILPVSLTLAGVGVTVAAGVGLRALAAAKVSLRAGLTASPGIVATGLVGASLGGVSGAAWGLALGQAFAAVIWWRLLLRPAAEASAPSTPGANFPPALTRGEPS